MGADYDVTYADDRSTVVLKASLDRGWRPLEKTYGFFRQMWIYFRGDYRVRTALQVLPDPSTFDEEAASFPDVSVRRGDALTNYEIEQKRLSMRVALRREQPWRLIMGKRPGIYYEDIFMDVGRGMFVVRAWLVFHPPGRAPIPDVRVWCHKMFVPGGQFESNRRRH